MGGVARTGARRGDQVDLEQLAPRRLLVERVSVEAELPGYRHKRQRLLREVGRVVALGSRVGGRRSVSVSVVFEPAARVFRSRVADEGVPDVEPPVVPGADEEVDAVHLEDVVAGAVGDDGGGGGRVVVVGG